MIFLAAVLTNITEVVTSAVGWMGSFLSTITATGNEILFIFCAIPLVGVGIGLVRRMLHV